MAILDTKPAAYKGVRFLMLVSRIEGGRKDIQFSFPNSDKQTVEDLGLKPREYSMNVIIPHKNYVEQRDRLLRALESGDKGPLDHPLYGRIENIVARTFTIAERLSDLGRAELQISFAIDDNIGIPQKSLNALSGAFLQMGVLSDATTDNIAQGFGVDYSFLGNSQDAFGLLSGVSDMFTDVVTFATSLTSEIDKYASTVNEFTTIIHQLIALPQSLANSVDNLFSTVNALFGSVDATYDAFTNPAFFDFGEGDLTTHDIALAQSIPGQLPVTQSIVQRARNRDTINQSMQFFALGYAYLNAAQLNFETEESIDEVISVLEKQYVRSVASACLCSQSATVSVTVSSEEAAASSVAGTAFAVALAALTDMRTVVNAILDDKRVESKRIVTINTKRMPMSVLAYRYYGNTDLTDTLLALNGIKGASFVEGDVRILTE